MIFLQWRTNKQSPPYSDGVTVMVEDILKMLPQEELEFFIEEKLKTSPEFKKLFDKLKTKEF
jgi:2-hydroxy-3-keto-5-methylthiopentenyl-1-phosphate phosphatase